MKTIDTINSIVGMAEKGNFLSQLDLSVRSFGLGANAINFTGENYEKYQDAIELLFSSDRDVEDSYTFKQFEKEFISHFSDFLLENKPALEGDSKAFFQALKASPVNEFTVYRPIQGVHLDNKSERLKLGKYEILHYPSVKSSFPGSGSEESSLVWLGESPSYLIGWPVSARHQEKATEIADAHFSKFELLTKYLIGQLDDRFEVGVLNYRGARLNKAYVFEPHGPAGQSNNRQGACESIPLDDPYFTNPQSGHSIVWELASKIQLNEFEKRLLLAIEWIAQAMQEQSASSAFIKAAISLEIFFTHNEKALVTPSILSQVAENTAMLLADGVDERLEIERQVKKLYSVRSSIAHSGKKDILREQLIQMLRVARTVVTKIITSDKLLALKTIEELYMLLKRTKYGSGAI